MISKKFFYLLALILLPSLIFSQKIDYNKIIPSDSVANKDIAEKLVQLAWQNNPDNKQVIDASLASKYEVKVSQSTWLNSLVAQGNLNEFSIHPSANPTNNYYPKYNISLSIPAGIYLVNHYTTQAAKRRYDVTVDRINTQKLDIRNRVLDRYQDYILAKELLNIQNTISDEIETQFIAIEKKYKENRVTFQTYNEALQRKTNETINRLSRQRDYYITKNDLERLVGVNIEQVIKK